MMNYEQMTTVEQQALADKMLSQMTPENRAKAEKKYVELLYEQMVTQNLGGRPRKDNLSTTTPPVNNRYYTVSEAVELLGVHRHTLQSKLREGIIKGKLIGRNWRIYRDSIFDNSDYLYFFDCDDKKYSDRYWTPYELSKTVSDTKLPMLEGEIIELAKSLGATLYRSSMAAQSRSESSRDSVMIYTSDVA